MPFQDVLLGLRAMFVEGHEAPARATLLAERAPGLSSAERDALLALEPDRVGVYTGLLREGLATMLDFVAPSVVEVAAQFSATPRAELSRQMLLRTPRRSSRTRELAQLVIDHLNGPGRELVTRCPPILDLARLEQAGTEAFYAPDDDAMSPAEFAAAVSTATVDEVLAFHAKPAAAARTITVEHDVLDWRDRRHRPGGDGAWSTPPPALDAPLELLVARDPATLQPIWHRLPPAILDLVRPAPTRPYEPLEAWAERWMAATQTAADDPDAAARFFETIAGWVRSGIVAVRPLT